MITESIEIDAAPQRVFDAFVHDIDLWWPRTGTYRYSFAPPHTRPASIRFEPVVRGRFYEQYEDGTEYVIGHVIAYEPPDRLAYTWRAPDWDQDTHVDVRFLPVARGTRVTIEHRGLPTTIADGYATGLREILAAFAQRQEENT